MKLDLVRTEKDGREIYHSDPSQYEVSKWLGQTPDADKRPFCWLCIKCLGNKLRDWRDFQNIKNLLCGPDCEAVEIYPAEEDLVDLNNSFHLWVFLDGYKMPFGFRGQRILADPGLNPAGARLPVSQRPFADRPADATNSEIAGNLLHQMVTKLLEVCRRN